MSMMWDLYITSLNMIKSCRIQLMVLVLKKISFIYLQQGQKAETQHNW
ncbi:hypothetical protein Hdeb2414_s0024g00646941 [Helianthus debilis subsp. tardiflorus]